MAKRFDSLAEQHIQFIAKQKVFFVGTAAADSRVNISPKGMDTLRVIDPKRVAWLNLTGSGNETAAHVLSDPRMTLMFCAFEGPPLILRLYGHARAVHLNDPEWDRLHALFPPLPGARQIFDLSVDLVQTSCGFGVPLYQHLGERDELNAWSRKKGEAGVRQYWLDKNQLSIDGLPTQIAEKNT
jgi:hypothetical protein